MRKITESVLKWAYTAGMSGEHLCEALEYRDWMITPEQVLSGELDTLLSRGLQAVSVCNDGTGRSLTVAKTLSTKHGIATVRLGHGFSGINEDDAYTCCKLHLFSMLNSSPFVVVILTSQEILRYAHDVNQLRASRHQSSDAAIDSVVSRYKNM